MERIDQGKSWETSAFWAQVVLLVYLQGIEWVNLFPWNDVRNGNGQEELDIGLGIFMAIAIAGTYRRWKWLMSVACLVYAVWMWLQIETFWTSYLFGASREWMQIWRDNFAQTTQVFSAHGNHLPPDASHFVLQLFLLVALVLCSLACYYLWRPGQRATS